MKQEWYKVSKFRNLVDMHINNGDESLLASFDADVYAENMKTAGFDTAYIYGSNCLGFCLYPTNIGYRHQIVNERDIFGETVEALRKRGIRPVGYLNNWCTEVYNKHPQWRVVGIDGTGHRDFEGHNGRYGICCFNSPYKDFFLSLVKEFCSSYDIEGLWIDMVGFWREACYCESCRKKFREETGLEIPEKVDWESPVWKRYVEFRQKSMSDYAAAITKAAKEAKPGITVSIQGACWRYANHMGFSSEYFRTFDYTAGDFYTDVREQAVDCKFLRGVSLNQPFEYMVPRCPALTYHTVSKPVWQLRQQAYSSFLHGGAFLCIDAIDPKGTLNEEVYKSFRAVKDAIDPYLELSSSLRGEYLNDVALYMNYESAVNMDLNGVDASSLDAVKENIPQLFGRFHSMNMSLAKRHIQYDIVTNLGLSKLSNYSVIILSELYTLTKAEIEAFTEYVKNGGTLYISGKTGLINDLEYNTNKDTLKRDDFVLSDLMGVSLVGEFPYDSCYIKGIEVSEFFSENDIEYPLGVKAPAPMVKANAGTKVLAVASLPISNHTDGRNFLSAISDPPWQETDTPVLTERVYGKGKILYSALLIEDDIRDAVSDFWLDIIEYLLKDKRNVVIDAPICVEASVKTVDDTLCVSLLNVLAHETRSPAGKTEIFVSGKFFDAKSAEVFPSGNVSIKNAENGAVIVAENLPEFAVVTIK